MSLAHYVHLFAAMFKYACVLPVALIGIVGFAQLGTQQAEVLRGAAQGSPTALSFSDISAPSSVRGSAPRLTSSSEAAASGALGEVARLASRVAKGASLNVEKEIAKLARRYSQVSVLDEFENLVAKLDESEWRPRLIHGLDPDTPWRDLDIVSVDLEGKIGEPTQIGLVQISKRELGNEITIRMTPSSGESTKKATRLRLLDSSKKVSTAGRFEESQDLFEAFTRDRIPLAFQHQGDLQGLMHEWSKLEMPGKKRFYVIEPEVEWIDVANWGRMLAYGDRNSLSHFHWRVLGEPLGGAHVGVNDARAAARVLFRLGEEHPAMPKTYGDMVKYQVAWRKHRGEMQALQTERLDAEIRVQESLLHEAFEAKLAQVQAN